jgi:pyrimidine deaminase RibD-like protein
MMASEQSHPAIAAGDHKAFMEYALEQARHSPPAPTKFCVGAVLVDADKNEILSTGWSLELPDNNPADLERTHAEQCCFIKVAQSTISQRSDCVNSCQEYSSLHDNETMQQEAEW